MKKGALYGGLALSALALGFAPAASTASTSQETVQSAPCPNFEDLFLEIALNHYLSTNVYEEGQESNLDPNQTTTRRIGSLDSLLTTADSTNLPEKLGKDPGYLFHINYGDQSFILEIRYNVDVDNGKAEFSPEYRRFDLEK